MPKNTSEKTTKTSNVKCPQCTNGKQLLHVSEYKDRRMVEKPHVAITCVFCNGTGELTPEAFADLQAEKEMWCECPTPGDSIFYDDGEHPVIKKHHYRCSICHKVTQIG